MRRAIAEAEVGNEQAKEDPTTNRLQDMVAELLGKDAALFLPSGTMCNAIAYRVHCQHGDEVIADVTCHAIHFETGGPAALSGVTMRSVDGERGVFTAAQAEAAIRRPTNHHPRSRLIAIEQTSMGGGGTVWPLDTIRAVSATAQRHNVATHMDGARLLNAVVASGIRARNFAESCDSVWIDLTKGLGCPVGAVLAGTKDFIEQAWRWKHQFGGAMRQSGVVAAAGVYALQHNVDRLAEDHANARAFAEALSEIPGVRVDVSSVETNILFFDVSETGWSAFDLSKRLLMQGIRVGPRDNDKTIRALTHLDVTRRDVDEAAKVLAELVKERRSRSAFRSQSKPHRDSN
jgi:threonine aldolase